MTLSSSHLMILLSALVLLLSAFTTGVISHNQKPVTCCKKTGSLVKVEPLFRLKKCFILPETEKCYKCYIFIDEKRRMYHINPNATWLTKRIKQLQKNGVECVDYTNSTNPSVRP